MHGFFITGTDTDVGKTWVTASLLQAFNEQGLSTIAMKPVASGCDIVAGELRNGDAVCLMQHMSAEAEYMEVNPYHFIPAIAPHIAAQQAGQSIDLEILLEAAQSLAKRADMLLVEGAGGWQVPLNDKQGLVDLAGCLQLPVIMVVAIRLGCLNHALLTAQSIEASGLPLAGWVANMCDDADPVMQENIFSLQQRLSAPMLAQIPLMNNLDTKRISALIDTSFLRR